MEEWTTAQEEQLEEAIRTTPTYGKSRYNWVKIAAKVDGKTKEQCRAKYRSFQRANQRRRNRGDNPNRKEGRFSQEETQRLESAANKYKEDTEGRWELIAKEVGTRDAEQCRNKFQAMEGAANKERLKKMKSEK